MKRNPDSCRPALHWPGGKSELLKYLLPIVDGTPHDLYCEPFAGGLAVLCAKKRTKYEIVNDLNGDVVNFYRIVKYHCEPFLSECQMVPNSREDFEAFKSQEGLTDIQRAARWFLRNSLAWGGLMKQDNGIGLTGGKTSREYTLGKIAALNKRMDRVLIHNRDWKTLLQQYDRESALFFLDPPYVNVNPVNYDPWTLTQVQDMADTLKGRKCKFIVTLNDLPEIREAFAWCQLTGVMKPNRLRRDHRPYGELIIVSPNITAKAVEDC